MGKKKAKKRAKKQAKKRAKKRSPARKKRKPAPANGANLGFEEKLWATADKLRGHMDAAEYKHVVLGLIFLKYISDAFQERHEELKSTPNADPEDRDEYVGENVFWVPPNARWAYLQKSAKQSTVGKLVDEAMDAIERDNPSLKGVLTKDYARPSLDKTRLGELIDLIAGIGLGDAASRSQDILGRVYEYFLGRFANMLIHLTPNGTICSVCAWRVRVSQNRWRSFRRGSRPRRRVLLIWCRAAGPMALPVRVAGAGGPSACRAVASTSVSRVGIRSP